LPAIALSTLALAGYIVTLTLYSTQLRLEQQRAEAAQAFMVNLLRSPDPFAPADPERGRNITVVEALDLGRTRLENENADQPQLRATLLGSIAGVYRSLDQNEEAIALGEKALDLNLELYGESSEQVLENLRLLADRHYAAGDSDRAGEYATRQLDLARAMYRRDEAELGIAEVAAGTFENSQGNIEKGLELLSSGIDKLRTDPETHAEMFITGIIRSTEQEGMNDAMASLQLLEEGLAVAESVFGTDSLYAAELRVAIGRNALFVHDRVRSEENYRSGLRILESQLGRQHAATIKALQDYGEAMNVTGDHAGSEAVFWELVDRLVEEHGERHKSVADNYQNLATTITYQERFDESVPLHRKAYEIYKTVLDDDNYIIAFPLLSIASIEIERMNSAAAESAAREALMRLRQSVPGTYVEGVALCLVGLSLEQQGDAASGSELVEASHELIRKRDVLVPKYLKLCRVPD
jgi:serine/threonine-protein kinase